MSGLKQQIEKKAIDLGDELRDNLALDSIAKAQIIETIRKFESFVLGLLANYVCIPRKQVLKIMEDVETQTIPYAVRELFYKELKKK